MQLINDESFQRVRSPLDVDNFSLRYKTSNGLYTFTSPSLWTIEKNYYVLLKNSTEVEFNQKYRFKPSYLSFDEYGTVILEYLLMYVNNVYCAEDFDLKYVIIPDISTIISITKDKFPKQDITELEEITW